MNRLSKASIALTLAVAISPPLRADDPGPCWTMDSVPVRFNVPRQWRVTGGQHTYRSTPEGLVEAFGIESAQRATKPGHGILAIVITTKVAVAPATVLERAEAMAVRVAPDLFSTGKIIKREPATLWGHPGIKLALRCTPTTKDGVPTNVVVWIATNGRQTILVQATAEPGDWKSTWQTFLDVTDTLVWTDGR